MMKFVTCQRLGFFSQTLTTLDLHNNRIGDDGAQHLAEALNVNQVTGSE
jgi:hypothetical protein